MIVQADPSLLSTDLQTKFQIMEQSFCRFNEPKVDQAQTVVLESEVLKMKQAAYHRQINHDRIKHLKRKQDIDICTSYNLRRNDKRVATMRSKRQDTRQTYYNADGSINQNWQGATSDEFKRYFCHFEESIKQN